jgi:hypothetical protein
MPSSCFLFRVIGWTCGVALAAALPAAERDATPLFDGRTLAGWRANEHPGSFRVEDGAIVCGGERGHLFYVGATGQANFENFELSLEVWTEPGSNSGVYFHTHPQESGWPAAGFEVQVNNSQPRQGDYLELKMTGSLYGLRNVHRVLARDHEWFTLQVRVLRPRVEIRVNGVLVVDYLDPQDPLPPGLPKVQHLGHGTFALQAHDPASSVRYRNIRVQPLPPGITDVPRPTLDAAAVQRLKLAEANFPLLDLHAHLKGGLTLERALAISRSTGMGLGIAANGGRGFPIQDDAAAAAFIESLRGQPVFVALQAEGREWMEMFSPALRARFDYIFTDAMTWTNRAGQRLRLWIPAEADTGADANAFMDELVETTVRIIRTEPIDVLVNPTFLPDSLQARYDELWTEQRMARVIAAAAGAGVAIELNARFKLPSEKFVRLAKAAGVRFTIGTNNAGADDFGDWSYPLQLQEKLGLTWRDMWVPGRGPTRAQRALAR